MELIKDLRVGNYLIGTYYGYDENGDNEQECEQLVRVTTIDSVDVCEYNIYVETEKNKEVEIYDSFSPVKITKDELIKLGFNVVTLNTDGSENFWSKTLDASIDVYENEVFKYTINNGHVPNQLLNVHNLQNLHKELRGVEVDYLKQL